MVRKRFLFFLVLMSILFLPAFVSAEVLLDQTVEHVKHTSLLQPRLY